MDKIRPMTLAALAAITGIFGAVVILAISFMAGWPWIYSVLGLAGISAISWLALMRRYLGIVGGNSTVTSYQPAMGYPTETTRIQITANDPSGAFMAGRFADLPVSIDTIVSVAKRLQAGSSFSHAGLAGKGRPLSRSQYELLRDRMIKDGLAYWINPSSHSQGCELTRAGRAVMEYFANGHNCDQPLPQLTETNDMVSFSPKVTHAHTYTRGNGREAIIDN